MPFKPVSSQVDFVALENEVMERWAQEDIVNKYLHKNDDSEQKFSFLDGPITANNPMGVHHAWGRTYKDLFQRYHNLLGHRQRFQNGFDEQGLWVEVEVEKELNLHSKKDILNLVPGDEFASLEKFITLCKERVAKYSGVQTEQSKRLGYFMDWANSYHTSSPTNNYTIWHFLKVCHDKGWVYKGHDSVPWCPRCGTAISQMEILTEDYKEVVHEAVYIKLQLEDSDQNGEGSQAARQPGSEDDANLEPRNSKLETQSGEALLVWTTTPWTIPANVAVAVNPEFDYVLVKTDQGMVWTTKEANERLQLGEVFNTVKGKELVGRHYKGPFDDLAAVQSAKIEAPETFHSVVAAKDLVVEGEGTGLVHLAPGAGAEDFKIGKEEKLPVIAPIDEGASYVDGFGFLTGQNAKKHPELIIDFLKTEQRGTFLYKTERYKHRYPICWRCKTELVWRVVDEWYIAVDRPDASGKTYREQMVETAKAITWLPKWGLDRELDWLKNLGDWLISKKRFWGLALPIYEDTDGSFIVVGSYDELKQLAIEGWSEFDGHTPHRPWIDRVKIKSPKTGAVLSRIPDVGNPWLDAGIVPFSTVPEEWFPADFITESFPGQFKNWFYALIAMSTALKDERPVSSVQRPENGEFKPFRTVLGFATVRDEKGQEMHKSKGNSIEFNAAAEQVGAEAMRWQYVTANPENNLNFGFGPAKEIQRRFFLIWWNVYNFVITYAALDGWEPADQVEGRRERGEVFEEASSVQLQASSHGPNGEGGEGGKGRNPKPEIRNPLDEWILSKMAELVEVSTRSLDGYDAMTASRALEQFVVTDVSQWFIRRSRDRVGPTAVDGADRVAFYETAHEVLMTVLRLGSPYLPFLTDQMYVNLSGGESVHLSRWPMAGARNKALEQQMVVARQLVEVGHSVREEQKLKLKQPLLKAMYKAPQALPAEIEQLLGAELNVLRVEFDGESDDLMVAYDVTLTDELRDMGMARELVRSVQAERKKLGCSLDARVRVTLPDWPESQAEEIKRQTLADELVKGDSLKVEVV